MRIRTQQFVSAGVSAVLVLLVGITLIATSWRVETVIHQNALARELLEGMSQRRFLMLEYIVYGTERARLQFLARQRSISSLFAKDAPGDSEAHARWDHIRAENDQFAQLFEALTSNRQGGARTDEERELANDLEAQLITQLLRLSQKLRGELSTLANEREQDLEQVQLLGTRLVIAFTALIGAIFLANAALVSRAIASPVARLQQAVIRVGGGDLDVRSTVAAANEIGDLARGFDAMTRSLREARTAREAAERQRKEYSDQLQAANKELEAFAYSVSHDLRAPLRSIDGFSQALLEDYEAKLDDEGKDSLHRVRDASQRMGQLIDDMLKLSRATRAELEIGPVDLSAIAESTIAELRRSEPERHVSVSIEAGVTGRGDARLLGSVLENLLSNAWKFTRKNDAPCIEFGAETKNGEVVCRVHDNGAGFDMAYAENLFAPFQRLHQITEFPGNGIGLATVKRVITRLGGRVWAEGSVGKGATFYFALPIASTQSG